MTAPCVVCGSPTPPVNSAACSEACEFLGLALELVESESIRAWARSEKNLPIWLQLAAGKSDPTRFAAFIVATAIGL